MGEVEEQGRGPQVVGVNQTKGLRKNNSLVYGWRDGVIPTRQMRVLGEAEGSHLLLGDLDARRVLGVEPVAHDGEAGLGGGGGDAVENGLE